MLSTEGVVMLERQVREHMKARAMMPKAPPKAQAAQITKKAAEIEQLRALMKSGTLSQAVAQAAIEKAQQELHSLEGLEPHKEERQTARVMRMLPPAAELLRQRIGAGNLGLRDPRSIVQGRNILFNAFGGKVPLRRAQVKPGEKPCSSQTRPCSARQAERVECGHESQARVENPTEVHGVGDAATPYARALNDCFALREKASETAEGLCKRELCTEIGWLRRELAATRAALLATWGGHPLSGARCSLC